MSSWADSVADGGPHHRRRPSYVPPHIRYSKPLSANAAHFSPSGQTPNNRNPTGRPCPEPNPLERFAALEISEPAEGINFEAYDDIPVEASGSDVPPPAETFADTDLACSVLGNVERCGYKRPTPVQRHAIPISLAGRDLMACAQTGSGKTAAFLFPIISGISASSQQQQQRGRIAFPAALIMSPTRELASQIHAEAKKFAYQTGIKVVVAYGGTSIYHQLRELEKGVDILVATPGRLVDLVERASVSLKNIKYLALDEADRMLDMGFEPQIRKIVEQMDMPAPGVRQTMLFSATFPQEIQRLASDFLSNYIFLAVGRVGSSTDLITQIVEYVPDLDKKSRLMDLLHSQRVNCTHGKQNLTLVFVETKRGADKLEHWLSMNGFPSTAIHGDRSQHEREMALKSFKTGQTPIMVATDVAARGLDVPHVAHVINFDLPKDIDDYVHRIGRTGRAGNSGLATAFFCDGNQSLAKALADLMQEAKQKVPDWLVQFADRASHGGCGRNRRFGGNRFGGHDYRKDASARKGNYYTNSYGGSLGAGDRRNHHASSYRGYQGGNDGSYHSSAYGGHDGYDGSYNSSAYGGNLEGNDSGLRHFTTYGSNFGGNNIDSGGQSYYSDGYGFGNGPVVATGWD